jgi:single-stranded-DNA-specific exonuclease
MNDQPESIQGVRHRWRFRTPDDDAARALAGELGVSPLMALLLTCRRLGTPSQARDFLSLRLQDLPRPRHVADLDRAVHRIARALEDGEHIVVYGDYDVDGVTATAVLVDFLARLGARAHWYLPNRLREGYGLNHQAVRDLHARGVSLVVTVDCGSADHEPIQLARELGLDVVVTDNHRPPDPPPRATALVNPKRGKHNNEHRDLAGVGVAFYLATALRAHFRRLGRWTDLDQPKLKHYLDWVALGTLADMVPLTPANRILAGVGLRVLSRTGRPGLQALKEVSGLDQAEVSDRDVAFRLGPRLNAPGRLGKADLALRLLLCPNLDEARRLAGELDRLNRQRHVAEERLVSEALACVQRDATLLGRHSLVLGSSTWHKGLLGLVASRLVERFNKPTVLLTRVDGTWEGSGRSPGSVDLHRALSGCREHLLRFGGHRLAAGLKLKAEHLSDFRAAFERSVQENLPEQGVSDILRVDAMARLDEITPEFMAELERMRPFGEGNPEPTFCSQGFRVENLRVLKGRHLQLGLRQGNARRLAIGFNLLEPDQVPRPPERLLFTPRWDYWQGERRLQLHILDYC